MFPAFYNNNSALNVNSDEKKNKGIENRIFSRDPRNPTHWARDNSSQPWMPRYWGSDMINKIKKSIIYPSKHQKFQYQKWRN